MELVHGVPITKYCDDNHLTPRERLELFVPVCQAIQHAHQKGIIHRDIKPSNVMVTLYDGKPVPKVIDFGVAKATEQKLTERTLFTQYGTMVGTLEYMSPEQAEMSALGVDTRSDIYSLGVLLYELLTGSTPLTSKRMKEAAYAEILRMIKEEEPPRPSTRLSDSGEKLASISALRKTEPAKLTRLVRGELDWIVMKTLEKDRNRRYETANGFAADVQRYLADEPVMACPPSAWYRLRKFARRNKRAFATASFIGLALLATLVTLAVSNVIISEERDAKTTALGEKATALIQAQANKDAADKQRQRAEENLELTANVLDQILLKPAEKRDHIARREQHRLLAANPERLALERELIEKGAEFYAQYAKRNSADPSAQLKAASAYRLLAYVQHRMGQQEKSAQTYRQGLRFLESSTLAQQQDPDFIRTQADLHHWMVQPLIALKQFTEAEQVTRRGLALYEKLAAAVGPGHHRWGEMIWSNMNLASLASQAGRDVEAEQSLRKARSVADDALRAHPGHIDLRYARGHAGNSLSEHFAKAGRLDEAIFVLREVVRESAELARETGKSESRWGWGVRLNRLGWILEMANQVKDAEQCYSDAFPVWQKLVQDFNIPDHRYHLGRNRQLTGHLLYKTGRLPEAAAAFQEAITIWEKLVAEFNLPDHVGHLGSSRGALQQVLKAQAEQAESAKLDDAVARHRKAIELDPNDALALYGLGTLLYKQKKFAQAEEAFREAGRLNPDDGEARRFLGHARFYQKKWAEAEGAYQEAIQFNPEDADLRSRLGTVLFQQNKLTEAEAAWREAIHRKRDDVRAHIGLNNLAWHLATSPDAKARNPQRAIELARIAVEHVPHVAWNTLGVAQYRAGDWRGAIVSLEKSMAVSKEAYSFDRFFLAMAQWQQGNKDEARKWYDQAGAWMDKNQPENEELRRFRAEAAELMGIEAKKD
jgi:tetratricopeptide (TPR) repeat protein